MAFGSEKLSYLIEVMTSGAQREIKALGDTSDRELGKGGKAFDGFKAKGTAALDTVKANAGLFAAAVGAALVKFGADSVKAFTDGALAAGKFSDATGVSNEEASRWIEIASDVGIGADTMQSALIRLEKAVAGNSPAFQDLGVGIARTKDGAVDANATLLNAIETLNGIPDPAKRAEAASALFGKGFAGAAEIITADAEEVRKALEGVSEQQVFDDDEVRKAREFRASMDNLNDKLEQVKMTLGEGLVPAISDTADQIVAIADAVDQIPGPLRDLGKEVADVALAMNNPLSAAMKFAEIVRGDVVFSLEGFTGSSAELRAEMEALGHTEENIVFMLDAYAKKQAEAAAATEGTTTATEDGIAVTDAAAAAAEKLIAAEMERSEAERMQFDAVTIAEAATRAKTEADEDAAEAAEELADQIDELYSANLRLVGGDIAVREAQRQATEAMDEYTTAVDEGKLSADEMSAVQDKTAKSLLDAASAAAENEIATARAAGVTVSAADETAIMRQKLVDLAAFLEPGSPLRTQIEGYIGNLEAIPDDVETAVSAQVDQASLDEAERLLEHLRRTRNAKIIASLANPGNVGGNDRAAATGDSYTREGVYRVGERGPEDVYMPTGARVVDAANTARSARTGGSGGSVVNNYTIQIDGNVNDERSLQVLQRRLEEIERRRAGQA